MSLQETLNNYYEYFMVQNYSPRSLVEYKRNLGQLSEWLTLKGVQDWKQVTPELLVEYATSIRKGVRETTYIQKLACIRGFYTYLSKIHGLPNYAVIVYLDLKPKRRLTPIPISPESLSRLRYLVQDFPNKAIFEVLLCTGVRASELLSTNLASLSLSRRELRIIGKGGDERMVLLTSKCCEVMAEYLDWRSKITKDQALFVSLKGKRMSQNQLNYLFRKLSKVIGSRVHPHLLRHTFATQMLEGGSTIREVQELLGHKRVETTARYTHVTDRLRQVHESIMGGK